MKLLNILVEDTNILDGKVGFTPSNFSKFKRYVNTKFSQEDTLSAPPLSFSVVDDIDYGTIIYGYFSKSNVIFKYFEEDLIMYFDTKYVSKKEVLQFSTLL
jgi:hypothetical protein